MDGGRRVAAGAEIRPNWPTLTGRAPGPELGPDAARGPSMTATAVRYVTFPEAADALGISIRTLQRRIKAGELRTMADGRRVLVGIEPGAESPRAHDRHEFIDAGTGSEIEVVRRDLVAAVMAAGRDREELLARADRAEAVTATVRRRSSIAWAAAAVAAIVAALGMGFALAAREHRAGLEASLAAAAVDLDEARARADAEAEARRASERERERLANELDRELERAREAPAAAADLDLATAAPVNPAP